MWRLTAPCVTDNSSAAALKLRRRAVASNARNAFKERRWEMLIGAAADLG
jgi:hypothetical protein